MPIQIAYISDRDIRARAEAFLAEYHPSGEIPVPIGDIVEFDLGVELLPLPDVERRFGFVAALSNDLRTIMYDENADKKNPPRFRYTLAHEVATASCTGTSSRRCTSPTSRRGSAPWRRSTPRSIRGSRPRPTSSPSTPSSRRRR